MKNTSEDWCPQYGQFFLYIYANTIVITDWWWWSKEIYKLVWLMDDGKLNV